MSTYPPSAPASVPPRTGLSNILSPEMREQYDKSAHWLKRAMIALDVLIVFYTLPHGIHAFGVGDNMIGILGVFALEVSFLFAASHFTFGLISSGQQRLYANAAWVVTTLLLMGNSVLSHLLYQIEGGHMLAATPWVDIYQGFLLPLTPLIAVVMDALLIAHHPKIVEAGRTMRHVATVTAAEQAADRQRQEAVAGMAIARTEAEAAKLRGKLEAERLAAEVDLKKLSVEVQEKMALLDFDVTTRENVVEMMIEDMNTYLDSDTSRNRIRRRTAQKITKMFDAWDAEDDPAPAPAPRPLADIRPMAIPAPSAAPMSYAPSTNGHGRPNPTRSGD